jgi:ferredoxin
MLTFPTRPPVRFGFLKLSKERPGERVQSRGVTAVTGSLERKVGALTVRIDRTTCIGTANCAKVAPELFLLDDERIVTFREPAGDIPPDRAIEACGVCPVDALSVFDADGRQLVP